MKKILYILISAIAVFTGCEIDPKLSSPAQKLCGEWELTFPEDIQLYVSFSSDMTFAEYQNFKNDGYELRRGTWQVQGSVLSGKYNDGEPWTASYKISFEGENMTMTSQNEGMEVNVYQKCVIPEPVKENSTTVVMSGAL